MFFLWVVVRQCAHWLNRGVVPTLRMSNCLLRYLAITAILLSWLSPQNCWSLLSSQCILLRYVNKFELTSLVIRFGLSTVLKQFSTLQGTRSLGGLPHSSYGETILSWYLPAVHPMVVDGRVNRVNRLVPWFWVVVRISVLLAWMECLRKDCKDI